MHLYTYHPIENIPKHKDLVIKDGNTIIMVTHNVKLCRDADMIFLLNDGFVKDFGNYDKIKKDHLFLKLLNEQ